MYINKSFVLKNFFYKIISLLKDDTCTCTFYSAKKTPRKSNINKHINV